MNRMLAVAFSLCSLAVSSLAFANENQAGNADPGCADKHAGFREKKLERFDADHDGKLSPAEREAMKAAWQGKKAERVARYDLNKDGVLDDGERASMRKEHVGKMLARLDLNKDGVLSAEEVKCTHLEKRFGTIDSDHSGTLSVDELVAAAPMGMHHHKRG